MKTKQYIEPNCKIVKMQSRSHYLTDISGGGGEFFDAPARNGGDPFGDWFNFF